MTRDITLPYGTRPMSLRLDEAKYRVELLEPTPTPHPVALRDALDAALEAPIEAPRLRDVVAPNAKVTVVVSDATRDEPRAVMLAAIRAQIPDSVALTVAVATGTHGPADLATLGLPIDELRIVNHDTLCDYSHITIGETTRGTPIRVHRCVVEADWVISTGRIKPHYFAGYSAGIKGIFPGLGANREIRINHRLKVMDGAVAGEVDRNPCRADMEEIVDMLPATPYILNVVMDCWGAVHSAVAGAPREALRAGATRCRPLFSVQAGSFPIVVVSDGLPLTASLYQASKLVAAVTRLVADGGTVIVAAECPRGTGPLDVVNRGIYEIGIRPRLPADHRVILVSSLPRHVVEATYCDWAPTLEAALRRVSGRSVAVAPHAGSLIVEAVS